MSAPRAVSSCRALPDYRLWLRFDDGREGTVNMRPIVDEEGACARLRNVDVFLDVSLSEEGFAICWQRADLRLFSGIFYEDLDLRGALRFRAPPRANAATDPAFARFMASVLA